MPVELPSCDSQTVFRHCQIAPREQLSLDWDHSTEQRSWETKCPFWIRHLIPR